jgi:queuosine precursor transporter
MSIGTKSRVMQVAELPHEPRYLLPLAMLFVAMLLIANTLAAKIIHFSVFDVQAGIVCFPITYIFGDVLVEVYGYQRTRLVIWTGLFCQILMAGFYYLSTILPAAAFWHGQDAWAQFFSMSPRIVAGSLAAYFAGEFVNAVVMSKVKIWTGGRFLWVRTIGSTIFGEGVDTLIFNVIAFAGVFATPYLVSIMISAYVLKVAYEIIATPLTYLIVGGLKRAEKFDMFDNNLKTYSPFRVTNA